MQTNAPDAAVFTTISRLDAAHHQAHEAIKAARTSPERFAARRVCDTAYAALCAAKRQACEAFAAERGWVVDSKKRFTIEMLQTARKDRCYSRDRRGDPHNYEIDHAEYFRVGRVPAAILTHSYAPWETLVAFAEKHSLAIEKLSDSWYCPGGCIAALFTRKSGVTIPRKPEEHALYLQPYGTCTTRREELHDEIVLMALAAKNGDTRSLQLLKRLARLWGLSCATGPAQRRCEERRKLYASMMRAETRWNRSHSEADRVVLSSEFAIEHPNHPAAQLPAVRSFMKHRARAAAEQKDEQRRAQETEERLCTSPPRGVPTNFYIDLSLETPANLRKARKLDLEGFDEMLIEDYATYALRWVETTDHKTLSRAAA